MSGIESLRLVSAVTTQSGFRLLFERFAFAPGESEIVDIVFHDTKTSEDVIINSFAEWESKRSEYVNQPSRASA